MLITLKEYASQHGVDPSAIRHRIQRGVTKAQKIGRDWLIDSDEPYTDGRETSGKYKRWRNKPSV